MKQQSRKSNGTGSIYFDKKRERWCAEIQWTDKAGKKQRKKFSSTKKLRLRKNLKNLRKL